MLPLLLTTVRSKLQTLWERGPWLNSIISCLFHTCTDRVPSTCLLKCQKFILLKFWKTNVHTQYHWAKVKMLSGSSQESVHLLLALSCGIPWFIVPSSSLCFHGQIASSFSVYGQIYLFFLLSRMLEVVEHITILILTLKHPKIVFPI
jgi:hypothetical protein